ncbi:MAG: hypothetical protein GF364_12580 [Candidatus Lokiarchaeota archaeon]|nr:hypothetical protein [Candidatus Lokiarchaeota archaeon]
MKIMDPYVIVVIIICISLAFSIGAQEETMSTTLGSGSLSVKYALIFGSILIFLGTLFLSGSVGKTLGQNILTENANYSDNMMYAVLITSIIWLLIGATTGVPVSLNQTVVGSIFGVLLFESIISEHRFMELIDIKQLSIILLGWVVGPLLVFFISASMEYIIHKKVHEKIKGLVDSDVKESFIRLILIGFVCLNQISTAGNQGGNTLGMIYGLKDKGAINDNALMVISVVIALVYLLGFLIFGRKLIKGLGKTMGNMRPSETLSVEFAGSLLIFLTTLIGLPVSGAQILIFSLLGTKWMRGEKIDRNSLKRMIRIWLILLPLSIGMACFSYFLLVLI